MTIAASWNADSFYMITEGKHEDGANLIAKSVENKWQPVRQPAGAKRSLAVDNNGNPAFTANNDSIWWKKNGEEWVSIRSCAESIAFGPDNSLYKLLCKRANKGSKVLKWNPSSKNWKRLSSLSAERLTIDSSGKPWIIAKQKVLRWQSPNWVSMGLQEAREI